MLTRVALDCRSDQHCAWWEAGVVITSGHRTTTPARPVRAYVSDLTLRRFRSSEGR
jgi:hypothetical protein